MVKFSSTKAQKSVFGNYPTDYARFESDGFLSLHGGARAWIDFNFGVGGLTRGASAPDLIRLGATSIQTLGFDGVDTLEQVSTAIELNHNWADGTVIKPHLHWMPTRNRAGNVVWQLEYVLVPKGSSVGASMTITVTDIADGAWVHKSVSFPDIETTGLTIDTQAFFRLFRDPSHIDDNYRADAALATFSLHVLVDTLGSREIGTK
jgi:hypothetical protein